MSFFKLRLEVMESRETPAVLPVDPISEGMPVAPPPPEPVAPAPAVPPDPHELPPMPEWGP